jgi:putative transposase
VGIIAGVIAEKGGAVDRVGTVSDHVHLLVEVDPRFGIHRLVKAIKGRSSGLLRQEYPWLRSRLPTVRTNGTVGGAPLSVIKRAMWKSEEPVTDVDG